MSENGAGNASDDSAPKVADRLHEHQSSQEHLSLRERASEKAHEETTVRGRTMERGIIFKFIGLLAFIAIIAVIMVLLWPSMKDLFNALRERLRKLTPVQIGIIVAVVVVVVVAVKVVVAAEALLVRIILDLLCDWLGLPVVGQSRLGEGRGGGEDEGGAHSAGAGKPGDPADGCRRVRSAQTIVSYG